MVKCQFPRGFKSKIGAWVFSLHRLRWTFGRCLECGLPVSLRVGLLPLEPDRTRRIHLLPEANESRRSIVEHTLFRTSKRPLWILAALLLPVAGWAQTYEVMGDTYISTASPTQDYGALGSMAVGGGNVALIQFDTSRYQP